MDTAALLRLNGVAAGSPDPAPDWEADLVVAAARTAVATVRQGRGLPRPVRERLEGRAALLARRTAHCLRLEGARVRLQAQGGRLAVVGLMACGGVRPCPCPDGPLGPLFLGADPEFVLQSPLTGRLAPASHFFPREGPWGCDELLVGGYHPVAELRPCPSPCPLTVVDRLRAALDEASRTVGSAAHRWLAGCLPLTPFPLGGHLHVSGAAAGRALVISLDNYVGLPLALLEPPGPSRRRRAETGFLGDLLPKPHGGVEYRTPASWLVSPRAAAAALCLFALVAGAYPPLRADPLAQPGLQAAFYAGHRRPLYPLLPRLWADLRRLPGYRCWRRELDWLADSLAAGAAWREGSDLRRPWGLPVRSTYYL